MRTFYHKMYFEQTMMSSDTFLRYCSAILYFEVSWQYLLSSIEFGIVTANNGSGKVGWSVCFCSGSFRHHYIRIWLPNRVDLFKAGKKLNVDTGYHLLPC